MPDPGGAEPLRPEFAATCLEQQLSRHPASLTYWVAYSGGLDSTVLLHVSARLNQRRAGRQFKAIHVHHGLHPAADAWAVHCERTCRALGIELRVQRVDARPAPGESPEAAARVARYAAIQRQMAPGDTVLVAQHQDDQAETLLLQLFRGAGLPGLAAMPRRADLAPGFLLRPFLDLPRDALREYAKRNGIAWVEDPSNQDAGFDRNFLRHRILPELKTHWPGLARALSRSAGHCAEALSLLDVRAQTLLASARSADDHTLHIDRLHELAPGERKLLLRAWLKEQGYRMPSASVLKRIHEQSLAAGADRNPLVRWPEGEVRRYRDWLYLMPPLPRFTPDASLDWPVGQDRVMLPSGNGELIMKPTYHSGIPLSRWQTARVTLRYRQGGEKIRLPGRAGAHELRKLFQEAGVPPWIRERTPLIYLDDRLAAVGGFWLAADVPAVEPSTGLTPEWLPPPGLWLRTLAKIT